MASQSMTFVLQGVDNLSGVMDRAGSASDRLARRLLKLGAVGTGPALGASMAAAAGAMVAGFASAGAAAGAFGAAVQPQIKLMSDNAKAAEKLAEAQETAARKKQVAAELEAKGSDLTEKAQKAYTTARLAAVDAEKAYQRQTKGMPKETADAALSLAKLKMAHEDWSASLAKDTMPLFTRGLDAARKALPYLTPLVKTTSRALSEFMDSLDGDGLKGFLGRLNEAAKKTLPDLLNTGRNVFVGLGGIISAFLPTSDNFTGGLERGSEAFAKWGQGLKDSAGFQRFMEIAAEGSGSLEHLATAAYELYDALRPITGAWVDIAEGAAKFIRWLPPETLAYIAGSLIAVKLATLGVNAALLLMNANPVTLTVLAVAALGAAFVTAWQKSQRFREIASTAFAVLAQSALGHVKMILVGLKAFSNTAITTASGVAGSLASAFGWVPEIGPKLKAAAAEVDRYRTDTNQFFTDAISTVDAYSRQVNEMPTIVRLQGDISNLDNKIATAQARVDSLKQKRATAVGADKSRLDEAIARAQAKVDGLRQKRAVTVEALDRASSVIGSIQSKINSLNSKRITLTTEHRTIYTGKGGRGPNAYADGGTPKAGELAMVGEEGPELVVFGQAARVFDAKTTASMLRGSAGAGRAAGQGLAVGLGSTGGVYSAARGMAGAVTAGIRDELEIASPSKKTKALAKDVGKGFISGLTGSRDKIKSVAADLAKDIKTAFSSKKESSLLKMVDRQTKKLLDAAAKRDKIAAKIAEAKAYASDVTRTARDQSSLSSLGMEPEQVTAGGIKAGLAAKLAQVKQFTRFIETLAKRGLNKGLIRQILNMGPEQGYAYANALAGADKATLVSINKTQSAIDKETTKLGRSGADILYDSGRNAGKGFLKGLEGQKKDIERLMLDIAKAMQKSIKKALGIKSPSTVMAQLGAYSTEGLARGLVDGMPVLDRALGAVSGRVSGIQPVLGRAAVAGRGAGGTVIHIHVDGAVVDTLGFARAARQALLELKRANGGGDLGFA